MSITSENDLEFRFETGKSLTGADFEDLIDSSRLRLPKLVRHQLVQSGKNLYFLDEANGSVSEYLSIPAGYTMYFTLKVLVFMYNPPTPSDSSCWILRATCQNLGSGPIGVGKVLKATVPKDGDPDPPGWYRYDWSTPALEYPLFPSGPYGQNWFDIKLGYDTGNGVYVRGAEQFSSDMWCLSGTLEGIMVEQPLGLSSGSS